MENKKRCPKCGEENPPEAVMCWACYTPLSSASAPKGTQPPQKPSTQSFDDDDDDDSSPGTQPWQIAIIAIGLIFALFMVGKNFLPSGSSDDAIPVSTTTNPAPKSSGAPTPTQSNVSASTNNSDASSVPAPQKLPFTIAVSPNPNISIGTMAIVPTDPNISTEQAAALASFTRNQFTQMKRWSKLYIYVIRDQDSAKQFANYQVKRRGAPLGDSDYSNLTNLWGSTLACYIYNKGAEKVLTPTDNPSGWWTR